MQVASLVLGLLAFVGMLVGLIPCFGWLNWLNLPLSLVGLIISIVALAQAGRDESKSGSVAGLVLCILALFFGTIRLILGGGVA